MKAANALTAAECLGLLFKINRDLADRVADHIKPFRDGTMTTETANLAEPHELGMFAAEDMDNTQMRPASAYVTSILPAPMPASSDSSSTPHTRF